MMPVLAQVTESLGEAIPTYQIDIDGEPKTASENGVYKVPTFIIYAGGHEKWRHVDEIAGDELKAKVRSYL